MRRWWVCACVVLLVLLVMSGCRRPPEKKVAQRFRARLVVHEPTPISSVSKIDRVAERLETEFAIDAALVVVDSARDRRRVLRELGTDGVEMVVSLGVPLGRQAKAESQAHPDTAFVSEVGPPREPNLAVMTFQLDGAAYLAGVAAALVGGSKAGIVRNDDDDPASAAAGSFQQGFRSRSPYGRFEVATGPDGAHALARKGVTVVLYAGNPLDPGVIAAAETAGLELIVIGEEALARHPEIVIAAIDVDLGEAVTRITRDVLDGTFGGREYLFDLGSGVVDLTLGPRFANLAGDDAADVLDEARAAVNAGMVEVEGLGL